MECLDPSPIGDDSVCSPLLLVVPRVETALYGFYFFL